MSSDYFIRDVRLESYTRRFAGGERSAVTLANDFEDWKSGTFGWRMQQSSPPSPQPSFASSSTLGWDTFNFTVIGSLELDAGYLVFDTDTATLWGDVNLQGVLATTRTGRTQVAVFNFMTLSLGKDVVVRLQGRNALSLLSRSSVILDTALVARPGTLGGFPGGGFLGARATDNNNQNGPGSTSVRVHVATLSTAGTHIPEIQEIETSAAPGQRIQGTFTVAYRGVWTQPIRYDTNAYELRKTLETTFASIGTLQVERDDLKSQVAEVGRLWRITFLTAVGNVPQLQVESQLTGLDATVVSRTVRDGNGLGGSFRLAFRGATSQPLPFDVSASELRLALLRDWAFLVDARVARTDASARCLQGSTLPGQDAVSSIRSPRNPEELYEPTEWLVPQQALQDDVDSVKNYPDKLCAAGRNAANGFVWKLQLWTTSGNSVPTSPSSPEYQQSDAVATVSVDGTALTGAGATAAIVNSQCFSLAFGGAGGSFAGRGGDGYDSPYRRTQAYGSVYSDSSVPDLLGGSGGAGGGLEPLDVFPVVQPTQGGAGGGALHLSAVNDLVIGENGRLVVNGAPGATGYTAGGGGSAGSILLDVGGTVSHHGVIEAVGGHGGASAVMPGGGGSGGRVAVYAQSFSTWQQGTVLVNGGASQDAKRAGSAGSTFVRVLTALSYRVDPSLGAAGTAKSLLVSGHEDVFAKRTTDASRQRVRNGPRFLLPAPSRPTRVSFFVRIADLVEGTMQTNRGAVFGLHRGPTGDSDRKDEFLVSVGLVDGALRHDANVFDLPTRVVQRKLHAKRWYKIDVLLNWWRRTYTLYLNDVLRVQDAAFQGDAVTSLSLNNYHAMATWWDEIYVGESHLGDFRCPYVRPTTATTAPTDAQDIGVVVTPTRTLRKLWATSTRGPATAFHPMVKHESHVSRRDVYKYNDGGLVPFDGAPHRSFLNDVRDTESEVSDGTSEAETTGNAAANGEELLSLAETLTLEAQPQDATVVQPLETGRDWDAMASSTAAFSPPAPPSTPTRPTIYWYSEVFNATTGVGAIGACSTRDYLEWRNEGLMLQFVNLTTPLGDQPAPLFAERPKVLWNRLTQQFVMWLHVDNAENTMGLAAVATSAFPNGPFVLQRSFYPDAPLESPGGMSINETQDQTVAVVANDRAYLIRSYFKTVEYWLPRSVMNPLWESVKRADGSTDFGLSYHRAFYHEGYDNPNDIYLQRWRMEDVPWEVTCCAPTDPSDCVSVTTIPSDPTEICPPGRVKKAVVGQSQFPAGSQQHLKSRYRDPRDDSNNAFRASSVPSHTSWGFQLYNVKTWRGNYFDALSTNLTRFVFQRFAGERRRLAIEEDPSVQFEYPNEEERIDRILVSDKEIVDKMLGILGVPISLAFRTKYSSFDLAEIDSNGDGKITASELATLAKLRKEKAITDALYTALREDFDAMKTDQLAVLDADGDGAITYAEFETWVGMDPNLLFDQFDLDKSGYLDENELARLMKYRQFPRLDAVIILLDPSFDGRVYYHRFRALLREAPNYLFTAYDFDGSNTLTQNEIDLLVKDLDDFADRATIEALKDPKTHSISKDKYTAWLSATTSLLGNARDDLKVDNAVHPTRPDTLAGPLHVVERRRAKYVAISRLTADYLATEGLLREIEGDFEGREALLNYFSFAEQLFGLQDIGDAVSLDSATQPYRVFLSSAMLKERASYWNGRYWEGRPSAPPVFTYGAQCTQYAGTSSSDPGCMPCLTRSTYVTANVDAYQSEARSTAHCRSSPAMDAYIKEFDQHVSIQLRYQQASTFGPQGLQPHLSPCINQSQFFPCDVHKILDGSVADGLRDMAARQTEWNLAWEKHPNNVGSSQKIRADDPQPASKGPSFIERFPERDRSPITGKVEALDRVLAPDQMHDVWAPSPPPAAKKPVAAKKKAATAAAKPRAKKAPAAAAKATKKPAKKRKKDSDEEEDDEDDDYVVLDDSDQDMGDASNENMSIEQIYQKKTQLEHILLRPDTYVGSIEPVTQMMWVFDDDSKKMEQRKITFVPGLYKIFDEIIVNACDNKQRDKSMDTLRVTIDVDRGEISVWNNGKGIPVALHKEHGVYVPELIFGHLLTGSNFDDKKKKTVGGRNGYGAKLANIFSTQFVVETADAKNNNGRGWKIKYHKGLGTSKSEDAKVYFSDLRTHQIGFVYEGQADGDSIDMAFSKKRVEERKDWLRGYEPGTHVDYNVDEMPYTDFVNKELILFSMADNIRSIPNLKNEIKVAQLAGYVSEHSAYHHGEQSLNGTIINMAQDFITEKVTGKSTDTFIVHGIYEIPDESTIVISELPVKSWTTPYKQFLETLIESDTIKDFKEGHTDTTVLFTISLEPNKLREIVNAPGGVAKKFRLESSISTSNMHLFDAAGRIKKYETPLEIMDEFYVIRLEFYHKRKESMLMKLAEQVKVLSNKARFILSVVSGKLIVNNRKKDELLRQLASDGYDQIIPSNSKRQETSSPDDSDTQTEDSSPTSKGYDYLLSMKIWSLTKEQLEKLQAELQQREQEYSELELTPVHELWLRDLEKLEILIHETEEQRERIANSIPTIKGNSRRPSV
ncbi:hypothetical protein ATCC90586_002977 [Pythium insidiosum]|nr:hypothetical protein ATCC90586_002977 [Pythium insidiosum]